MTVELSIRCSCGNVRGVIRNVSPETINRVVCCCDGCQEYARAMGREDEILDEYGGTDLFQASPASLEITDGREHLRHVQQTPKGALRWYAGCCNSPVANTLSSLSMPFMAVLHTIVDRSELEGGLGTVLGPVRVRVNGRFDRSLAVQLRATKGALLKMLFHYAPMFFWWALRGDQRRWAFEKPESPLPPAPRPNRLARRGCG